MPEGVINKRPIYCTPNENNDMLLYVGVGSKLFCLSRKENLKIKKKRTAAVVFCNNNDAMKFRLVDSHI